MNTDQLRPASELSTANKLARAVWDLAWLLLFRPTARPLHAWRCTLLRLFGARIGRGVRVYQSVRVWAPWNLVMDDGSCLGDWVDCYNVDKIHLGKGATVSQYSYLCTASHDYKRHSHDLITAPIHILEKAWVTADVYVGPGVTIGEGAVVGVRSTVIKDVPAWSVVAGSPPRKIAERELLD